MSHRQICTGLAANGGAPLDTGDGAGAVVHTVDEDGFTDMVRLVLSNVTAGALVVNITIAGGAHVIQHSLAADTTVEFPDLPVTGEGNTILVAHPTGQIDEIFVTATFVRDGA